MDKLLFDDWASLVSILISAPLLYAAVIAMVRLSGKRSTSQMNNFDWIVTVAIGSLLASGIVVKDVALVDALAAIALLFALQYIVTRSVLDQRWLRRLVKARPALLLRNGEYVRENMRSERVTEGEVLAAVRGSGISSLEQVAAVVLETDAHLSVIPRDASGGDDGDCLTDVQGARSNEG